MKETGTKLDRIVEQFGEQIVHGAYIPDSALPSETELCKTYEISRATLREVVKVLGAKKLIDVQKHKGLLVMPREKWNYLDTDVLRWVLDSEDNYEFIRTLLETRIVVEPAIAEWAAQRATAADLAKMEAALFDMEKYYEDKNAFNLADIRFHQALIASAHNFVIEQLGDAISSLQRAVFDVTYFPDHATKEITIAQHQKLFDAVRLKNPKVARKISSTMIEGVEKRITQKRMEKTKSTFE
ncbi:MAG: FadR/GntR family transcriptional regulator [Formivibrio sp.]|nr:FadR/GntR family transcriptional regulator [Formivibrio sp.]